MIDFEQVPKNPKTANSILNSKFPNTFPKFGSPSKKSDIDANHRNLEDFSASASTSKNPFQLSS